MKKIILNVGAIGTIALPTMAVVSCGNSNKTPSADQNDVDNVATLFANLTIETPNSLNAITKPQPLSAQKLSSWGLVSINGNDFIWPPDLKGTVIKYTMPSVSATGQAIQGKIIIAKHQAQTSASFKITKIAQDKFDVEKVQALFANLVVKTKKNHAVVKSPLPLDSSALNQLGLASKADATFKWPTDILNTKITYTMPEVKNFGSQQGKIFIAKNGYNAQLNFTIDKVPYVPFVPAAGSKITNGRNGKIFQTQNGDIYAMGWGVGLEVLKNGTTDFKDISQQAGVLTGQKGLIFQAQNGDVYVTAKDSVLRFLDHTDNTWKDAPGCSIIQGADTTMFQAKNGDLYVMNKGKKVQVLKKGTKTFVDINVDLNDGNGGMMLQYQVNGNIYAMAANSSLKMLKGGTGDAWINAKGDNINNGYNGFIFQDKDHNIYAGGNGTGLEVLEAGTDTFKNIAQASDVHDAEGTTILQDQNNGNLFIMSTQSRLRVLNYATKKWAFAQGSKIKNGIFGQMFQAQNGNIYAMSDNSGLEVMDHTTSKFKDIKKASGIARGKNGTIFEDVNHDIFAMAYKSQLRVLNSVTQKWEDASGANLKTGGNGKIFQAANGDIYLLGGGAGLQVSRNI